MLGLRLSSILEAAAEASDDDDEEALDESAFIRSFSPNLDRPALDTVGKAEKAIEEELRLIREVMEKTKYLESKVSYQVKKLVALASSAENSAKNQGESSTAGSKTGVAQAEQDDDEEEEQDQLSYKPNVGAILSSKSGRKSRDAEEDEDEARMKRREKNTRRSVTPSDEEEGGEDGRDGIYRPPRLGAIPYNEGRKGEFSRPPIDRA